MARSTSGTASLASEWYRHTFLKLPCVCSSRNEFSILPHYPPYVYMRALEMVFGRFCCSLSH